MRLLHIRLVLLLLGSLFWTCSEKDDQIQARYQNIVEAVYASGTIHPLHEYKAYANASGILRNLLVREGDSVRAAQLLFEVESKDPELRAQAAREALDYARVNAKENSASIEELRANAEAARVRSVNDSLVLHRMRTLLQSGSTTQSEVDRVHANFLASRSLWVAAEQRLRSTQQTLANQLKYAQRQYEIASSSQDHFQVRSRFDARVYALYREEGEMITASQPVALLGDAHDFMLRLVIDASDVARVKSGQKVLYTVDAFPDSIFSATVVKVFPVLENETQSFRVDAHCDRPPLVPFVGTQLQANIVVSEKEHALVIPRAYLQPNNQVLIKDGSSITSKSVKLGISSLEFVEILSGIDTATKIVRSH